MLKNTGDEDKRKQLRTYYKKSEEYFDAFDRLGKDSPDMPAYPARPESIGELLCGARTRAGTPCKRKDLYGNFRCRLHGGLSTGPITKAGKRRSAQNGFIPKKKRSP